jgi:hypothetical protein
MNDDCEQEGSSHISVNTVYSKKMATHQQRRTSFLIYNTLCSLHRSSIKLSLFVPINSMKTGHKGIWAGENKTMEKTV